MSKKSNSTAMRASAKSAGRKPVIHLVPQPRTTSGHTRARLHHLDAAGGVHVELDGEVRRAAVAFACSRAEVENAIAEQLDGLVTFVDHDPGRPVVVGIVRDQLAAGAAPRHLDLEASSAITLRAGQATIRLHADGRVEIRGLEIVSIAEGSQRILGGSVTIN